MKSLPALDDAIRLAERELIERDARVRRDWHALGHATHAAQSRATRSLGWSAALGAIVYAIWRALPRFGREAARAAPAAAAAAVPALSAAPIASALHAALRTLAVVLPMLPAAVLKRTPARVVAALIGLTAPRVGRARAAGRDSALAVAGLIDPRRFAGRWYEIARLPTGADAALKRDVKCDYAPVGDTWAITRRGRRQRNGSEKTQNGVAKPRGEAGKLRLSFAPRWLRWLPLAWADHWILHVDPAYRTAMVGTPDRRRLWLLARSPQLEATEERRLADRAQAYGFAAGRLEHTPQRQR